MVDAGRQAQAAGLRMSVMVLLGLGGVERSGDHAARTADALNRIALASEQIGTCVVMLDIFDEGDAGAVARRKSYYEEFGFTALPSQPLRMFMPIATARALSG